MLNKIWRFKLRRGIPVGLKGASRLWMSLIMLHQLCEASATECANTLPIVKNGSFEQWSSDNRLLHWKTGSGFYEKDSVVKTDGAFAVKATTGKGQKNSRLYQSVTLMPHKRYKLICSMRKDSMGSHEMKVSPLGAKGVSGKPVCSISLWSWPLPYTVYEKEFVAGDATSYRLELKQHASERAGNYWDDVQIVPLADRQEKEPSPGLYTQSTMRPFSVDQLDEHARPLQKISLLLTRNETEASAIILRTGKRALSSTIVKLAGSLKGADGAVIPSQNVTIRSSDGRVLPIATPRDLPANTLTCWQVFVTSNEQTLPGTYQGLLLLQTNGVTKQEIPLFVEIVDVTLPEADIAFSIYSTFRPYAPGSFINSIDMSSYMRKIFADMKAHGMNTLTTYNTPHGADGKVDFDHNGRWRRVFIPEKHRDWSKEADPQGRYNPDAWDKCCNFGMREEMELALETGLISKRHPVVWLPLLPGNYTFGGIPSSILEEVLAYGKANNWPELLLYMVDEPGDAERQDLARNYYKRIKDAGLNVRTVTANPDPDQVGDLYDVWIFGSQQNNRRNIMKAIRDGKQFGFYNCSVPNNNACFFRAMYGFGALSSRFSLVTSWTHYGAKDKFVADEDGNITDKSAANLSKIGLSPSGPVPTVAWEAIREGTEDYRLAQLFESLYSKLEASHQARMAEIRTILSDSDISRLRKIEKDKYKEDQELTWTGSTPEKEEAGRVFQKLAEQEYVLKKLHRSREFLLDGIPETLGVVERVAMQEKKGEYAPDLGENDPVLGAELKRLALIPLIMELKREYEQ